MKEFNYQREMKMGGWVGGVTVFCIYFRVLFKWHM
jgi:hypothetical protein